MSKNHVLKLAQNDLDHWNCKIQIYIHHADIIFLNKLFSCSKTNLGPLTRRQTNLPSIFPSSFLQLVNSSKNSILNWVMKHILFMFFFFFVFETPLEDFPFYSPMLPTLWFRCLQTCIKESCMYLPSQLIFKTTHNTL